VFRADTGVIVMTAHGGVDGAVEAMRRGAVDYLVKPFESGELPLVIERARQSRQAARVEEHRRGEQAAAFIFGSSLASLEGQVNRILEMDRRTDGPLPGVLIQGETGTGKTALARLIHQRGPRARGELVEVNCSTLPEALAESELFGHEAGAFTDARKARMGLFEAADGGTLFLDEIPSLSLPAQAKVLIAIEEGRIRRVGANKTLPLDVRVIAATNRNLPSLVEQGQFRDDLYHRLDLYRLAIPPLRDRGEDIVKLAGIFAARFSEKHRLTPKGISAAGRRRLLGWRWPGNVRELAHEMERAMVFEEGAELDFPNLAESPGLAGAGRVEEQWPGLAFRIPEEGFSLEEAIERLTQLAVKQAEGNVSAAARLLGMPRDFVRYRLKRGQVEGGGK
jgi:DNA-binding NtrC family response regulator